MTIETNDVHIIMTIGFSNQSNANQVAIQFEDEGIALGTKGTVNEIDFVGSGVSVTRSGDKLTVSFTGGSGSGTVSSFSAGNLSPLFTSSVATATTTPALTFALNTQNANKVFAGPTTGADATPTFRALVAADIPDLSATYQPLDGDLTAIAALGFVSTSFLKKTAANTWALDTNTYLTSSTGVVSAFGRQGVVTAQSGDYDTSLVTENTNLYFTEPRVRATVLTGLSVTGGSIASSDSVITAFGKLQNQINGVLGGAIYQGVWNANTNSPSLVSSTGTKGYYYVVSVAGSTNLDGTTDWKIGDWAIFNGTTWDKVDNTDAVSSVNGLTGAVALTGTSNRITISGANVFDISASYAGQASITTLGTIGTGTWQGTIITSGFGGTGNGFTKFSGPTTSEKTFTLPNVSATILTDNAVVTLAQGGTNASLTASNGGIFYSTASAAAILAGTATANKLLVSGASGAPSWSTPTFPNASATTRKIIVSDGTNWIASTETWAVPGTSGNVLTSDGTNWTSAAPASATGAYLLASGGTATASNTFTFNTNGFLTVNGTWTATATNQFHANFAGSFTARNNATDDLAGYKFSPTLIAASTSQVLTAIDINPTFTLGGFAPNQIALRIQTGDLLLGRTSQTTTNSKLNIKGESINTFLIRAQDSSGNDAMYLDLNGTIHLGTRNATISSSNTTSQSITGYGLRFEGNANSTNRQIFTFALQANVTDAAADNDLVRITGNAFAPASGSGGFRNLRIAPTYNQSGTASGSVYGIYYDPTLTSVLGTHYAIVAGSGLTGLGLLNPTYQLQVRGTAANQNLFVVQEDGGTNAFEIKESGGVKQIGFFAATPAAQQTSGANLTNSVTSGGTDDTIANYTDLVIYANDAAAIRNDIYQLARKLKQVNDGLRTLGLFT